jgi:hypothetical protein
VLAVKPVRALVKTPVPVPSEVLESLVVGAPVVFQHTPRAVTPEEPSLITAPPLEAVVDLTELAAAVVTVGGVLIAAGVVKLTWSL